MEQLANHVAAQVVEDPGISDGAPAVEAPAGHNEHVRWFRPALWMVRKAWRARRVLLAGLDDAWLDIVRATRSWIQYGTVGFAVLCILIGAVEALFGR